MRLIGFKTKLEEFKMDETDRDAAFAFRWQLAAPCALLSLACLMFMLHIIWTAALINASPTFP